ncbi:hypothetical protein PHET_09613 [Paragonimus heterotremus]|uniref:Uncharacterized protein n=1 Tax=Paragonimus heterotremus TaxID=100268 RepID=A0A8J4WEN4_9TREM|nr:hypothetical protein PHET_09613 [Paragonimus heterotremus]
MVSTGKPINIGLLWRQDMGLTLLVDGFQFTNVNDGGVTVNNEKLAQLCSALGHLNYGIGFKRLTPHLTGRVYSCTRGQINPIWEMADYAIVKVAYFSRLLTS